MHDTVSLQQGSPEWHQARLGSLGASRIADALAATKSGGWGASRANLMAELMSERLTGNPFPSYTSQAMQYGIDMEPEARKAYAFHRSTPVEETGLHRHPKIAYAHASPDGLIGDIGLVEIKCPNIATHLDTLMQEKIPDKYFKQAMWQMACCPKRKWVDYVSYDNRVPEPMRLWVKRIPRDNDVIHNMELQAIQFLGELESNLTHLRKRYR